MKKLLSAILLLSSTAFANDYGKYDEVLANIKDPELKKIVAEKIAEKFLQI